MSNNYHTFGPVGLWNMPTPRELRDTENEIRRLIRVDSESNELKQKNQTLANRITTQESVICRKDEVNEILRKERLELQNSLRIVAKLTSDPLVQQTVAQALAK